ncbi:hypothetical protein MGA5115_03237 [Marinomonas gallaica]|uniref:Uncharacterized protein n=1 Tax=Marinomonas gallaica TaxID=1806667 RepID=A0A1C3JVJ6_9GAMM|nr:hypothetical protein [Marinomonas gallaica]SBT19076.1 hypothetical protein MGA5115_03237 [Marinomonas gallaica]SBT20849.1 hypothetical protein MGA5116_01436 [Marinomonas gallaica]
MSVQSIEFEGADIRVAELQTGRYFNKADLLRVAGKAPGQETECQYLDILEASKLVGVEKENLLNAMQLWAPHLCPNSMVELH